MVDRSGQNATRPKAAALLTRTALLFAKAEPAAVILSNRYRREAPKHLGIPVIKAEISRFSRLVIQNKIIEEPHP